MSRRQDLVARLQSGAFEPATFRIGERHHDDQFVLAETLSPLLRRNLQADWEASPQQGAEATEAEADTVIADIKHALASDVDAILYRLAGASPEWATPMEYGGRYLEEDRRILDACNGCPVVVEILGSEDLYLDCLSDLKFDAWTWEETTGNPAPDAARALKDVPFVPQAVFARKQEATV